MTLDPPVLLLIAVAAILVAALVARRSGEHADQIAGRRPVAQAARRGPFGAVADLLDQSVAAYGLRQRFGVSTRTRAERSSDAARLALEARAEEIRQHRTGAPPARPTHLVVAGRADAAAHERRERYAATSRPTSTLPLELVTAVFAFVVVVGLVIAIWPRGTSGGVLSATGVPNVPAVSARASTPVASASMSPTPASPAP